VDDVAFIGALIDQLTAQYAIGHSSPPIRVSKPGWTSERILGSCRSIGGLA
jgi:hypothetical protein